MQDSGIRQNTDKSLETVNKSYAETETYQQNYQAEKTPWIFRLRGGKLVEDSDIGPSTTSMGIISLKNMFIAGIYVEFSSYTNVAILVIIALNKALDLNLYSHFTIYFFIGLLILKIIMTLISELIIYRKIKLQEKLWLNFKYLRYNHKTNQFEKEEMRNLKVGDMVLIKKGELSPADLVVLNTSKSERGRKIFKVLNADEKQRNTYQNKNALKAIAAMISPSNSKNDDYNENASVILSNLNGTISYKPPDSSETSSISYGNEVIGSFKMMNDPKAYHIEETNIMEFSSKLSTDWIYGIILYIGVDTKILRKMKSVYEIKNLYKKKKSFYHEIDNQIVTFLIPGFLALTLFCYLSYAAMDIVTQRDMWIQGEKYSQVKIFLRIFIGLIPGLGFLNSIFYRIMSIMQASFIERKHNKKEILEKKKIPVFEIEEDDGGEEKKDSETLENLEKSSMIRLKNQDERDLDSKFEEKSTDKKEAYENIADRDIKKFDKYSVKKRRLGIKKLSYEGGSNRRIKEVDRMEFKGTTSLRGTPKGKRKKTPVEIHAERLEMLRKKKLKIMKQRRMKRKQSKKRQKKTPEKPFNDKKLMNNRGSQKFQLNLQKVEEIPPPRRSKTPIPLLTGPLETEMKPLTGPQLFRDEQFKASLTRRQLSRLDHNFSSDNIRIFNKDSFFEIGSIDRIIFAKSGVLTLGDIFIGSLTTKSSMYLIQLENIDEVKSEYGKNPQEFIEKYNLLGDEDDNVKEAYSEKSQEFDKELNYEYHPAVFDEDNENFDEIFHQIEHDQKHLFGVPRGRMINQREIDRQNLKGARNMNLLREELTPESRVTEHGKNQLLSFEALKKEGMPMFELQINLREQRFRQEMSMHSQGNSINSPISPFVNNVALPGLGEKIVPLITMKGSKFIGQEFFVHHMNIEKDDLSLLMKAVSVCHEKPTLDEKDEAELSSLDKAILNFLGHINIDIKVNRRSKGKYEKIYNIKQGKKKRRFNVLALHNYNKRGRMSIIINEPIKGKVNFSLLTRGDYNNMKDLLNLRESDKSNLKHMIASYKVKGFSPLIYAQRILSSKDIMSYMDHTQRSSLKSMMNKKKQEDTNMEKIVKALENNLSFIGCIGVGEVINQEAKNTIDALKKADIGVGIISEGNASSTLEASKRLGIYDPDSSSKFKVYNIQRGDMKKLSQDLKNIMDQFYRELKAMKISEIENIKKYQKKSDASQTKKSGFGLNFGFGLGLNFGLKKTQNLNQRQLIQKELEGQKTETERCMVISGQAFRSLQKNKFLKSNFIFIASFCSKTIGYNFKPEDKRNFVKILRKSRKKILAVGNSLKDIGMVNAANVGFQLCSSQMQIAYGDITIKSMKFLKDIILKDGVHFQISYYLTIIILLWFNLNFALFGYVYKYSGLFASNLFEGIVYYILSLIIYFIVGYDLVNQNKNLSLQQGVWGKILPDYFARKREFFKNYSKILGVLSLICITEVYYLEYVAQTLLASSTSKDGYNLPTFVIKSAYFVIILCINVTRISFFHNKIKHFYILMITLILVYGISVSLRYTEVPFFYNYLPLYFVLNCYNIVFFLLVSIFSMAFFNWFIIYFFKNKFIFSIQKDILKFWNFKAAITSSMYRVEKKIQSQRKKYSISFKQNFENVKYLLLKSKFLDPLLIKIFGLDTQERSRTINNLTCEIVDRSKKQRYEIYSRKRRSKNTKQLLIFTLTYQVLSIILSVFKTQNASFFDYLFKTMPLYNAVTYTILYGLLAREKKVRNMKSTAFKIFLGNSIIDLFLGIFFRVENFQDDFSIFNYTNFKFMVLPVGFGFLKCLMIYPILLLSNIFRFEQLGGHLNFFTVEFNIRCIVAITIVMCGWIGYKYKYEYLLKIDFLSKLRIKNELDDSHEKIAMLLPAFVIEKMDSFDMSQTFLADDAGEISVLFCDICEFNGVVNECQDKIIDILDDIFRAFDLFCKEEGIQKVETVGKTYMACGGLKFLESKLNAKQRGNKPCKRVINVAKKMMKYTKQYEYKQGKCLTLKIGIHHGNCIIGLLGYHKPQFSLIGDTINTTSRHCTTGENGSIIISAQAYAQISNDPVINVREKVVWMKGKGDVATYILRQNLRKNAGAGFGSFIFGKPDDGRIESKRPTNLGKFQDRLGSPLSRMESGGSFEIPSPVSRRSSRYIEIQQIQEAKARMKSGLIKKPKTKSDFKEKPENKKQKNKQKSKENTLIKTKEFEEFYLENLLRRNKNITQISCLLMGMDCFIRAIATIYEMKVIVGMVYMRVGDFVLASIFVLNYYLMKYGTKARTIKRIIYFGFILRLASLLLEYQVSRTSNDEHRTNQVAFEITLYSLITSSFFSCCGLFKIQEAMTIYILYLLVVIYSYLNANYGAMRFSIILQNISIIIFNIIEIKLLDKSQDKNFRNFLEIESQSYKISEFVGRLLPKHMMNNLGNFGARLGETYKNVTMLYADIVGFTAFSSSHSSREVVEMLSRLFTSFDIECQKLDLFKIYTIGDCYVVMSFTDKNNRKDVSEEATNVVKLGIKMIKIIQDVKKKLRIGLDMRIGIHTGDIIAGIVGTELVRFDIYGKDVVIANKMESKGQKGKICVSAATRDFLEKSETCRYEFEEHKVIQVEEEEISSYFIKF